MDSKEKKQSNQNDSTKDEKPVSESGKLETKPVGKVDLGVVRNNPNEYVLGVFYNKNHYN